MDSDENQPDDGAYSIGGAAVRLFDGKAAKAMWADKSEAQDSGAEAFPELMARLRSLLQTYYPPHIIAVMAGWGLRVGVGPLGVGSQSMIKGMSQHHVELLQAISLSLPRSEWGEQAADMSIMQEAIDIVLALPDAFVAVRRSRIESTTEPVAATMLSLQERLRIHTQMVRNWGGYQSMLEILRRQYAPLDLAVRERKGFGVFDVIAVIEATVAGIENQVGERFRLLKEIFRTRTIPELVRDFFQKFPGVEGDPEEFLAGLDANENIDSVRAALISHADRWLVVNAMAPVASIAMISGLSEEKTREVLDLISMPEGALSTEKPEHFFLANPVWTKPGIKCQDTYFFAFPQTAVSFLNQILQSLLAEAGLKDRSDKRRATFLEEETLRIVGSVLPRGAIKPEAKWSWQGTGYETDVLVVLDRTVLIVECKSASLSPQGLRGAPERARRHVRELVAEPAVQSARLARVIELGREGDATALEVARELGIEPAEITTTVRISVTLDDLTILSAAEGELKAAGWIANDLELPTTLNIADLACVADMLERPTLFLDYFKRRERLQKTADVIGFELDFLGLYLETNFDVGSTDGHRLVIAEMSQEIDCYYQNVGIGHQGEKPAPRLHADFDAILRQLETRRPRGWTAMAMDLLSIGNIHNQTECTEAFEKLRSDVSRTKPAPENVNGFFVTPTQSYDVVIVFHAFRRDGLAFEELAIRRLAGDALEQTGRSRCVFISRMIEAWDAAPYSAVGVIRTTAS